MARNLIRPKLPEIRPKPGVVYEQPPQDIPSDADKVIQLDGDADADR